MRDEHGRFLPGNPGGPGNPYGQQTAALRSALYGAVTPEDIEAVARRLVALALGGDVAAARLLFDRCLGRDDQRVLLERAGPDPVLVTPEQIALMMAREREVT